MTDVILNQSMSYNTHTASTQVLDLPESGGCSGWGLLIKYTANESGTIAQGENIAGMINKLTIRDAEDGASVFHAERNEVGNLALWTAAHHKQFSAAPAFDGGATRWGVDAHSTFLDTLPVKTEEQFAWFYFNQRISFDSLVDAKLELILDCVTEITTASSFSADVKFFYTPATVTATDFIARHVTSSETRSEIDLGGYPVTNIMLNTGGSAKTIDEISLVGSDGGMDVHINEPMEAFTWSRNAQVAGLPASATVLTDEPTCLVSGPMVNEHSSNRKLIIRNSSAAVSTVHYMSLARLVEHDETRAPVGTALRTGRAPIRDIRSTKGRGRKLAGAAKQKVRRALGPGFRGRGLGGKR